MRARVATPDEEGLSVPVDEEAALAATPLARGSVATDAATVAMAWQDEEEEAVKEANDAAAARTTIKDGGGVGQLQQRETMTTTVTTTTTTIHDILT